MVGGGIGAQRGEELRRQQQHEETASEGQRCAPGADGDASQKRETDIDGDKGDTEGAEKFQHG